MHNHKDRVRYKYAPLENGVFYFPIDNGSNLVVSIKNAEFALWQSDYLLSHDSMLSIEFERKCDTIEQIQEPIERETCDTILKIISSNIESNGDYCVYYHHWDDDNWYEDLYATFYDELESALPNYEAFEFSWFDHGRNTRILSVFLSKTNPDKHIIVEEFRKIIEVAPEQS